MSFKRLIIIISLVLIFATLFCEEVSKERQARIALANADTLFMKKSFNEAVAEYEKSLGLFKESINELTPFVEEINSIYFKLYASTLSAQQYEKSVNYGVLYLEKDSMNVKVVKNVALISKKYLKDLNKSISIWKKYDSINSTDESKMSIGVLYDELNDNAAALEWYKNVTNKDAKLLDKIASLYIKTKQFDMAIKTYEEYLQTNPTDADKADTYKNMGKLYSDQKNDNKAAEYYKKAIEIKADEKLILFVAFNSSENKDYAGSIKYAQMLLAKNANNADGLYYRALGYYNTGKKAEAKADFLKLEKNAKYGKSATSYIKLIDQGK